MKGERLVLRKLIEMFGVSEKDLPKTIQRFRDEIREMEKQLDKS